MSNMCCSVSKGSWQSSWSKGISETKSKQQSPCSNCMHRPVMSRPTVVSHHRHRTYENKKMSMWYPFKAHCGCDIMGRSHALTAWHLKFQVCPRYTFTSSYFGFLALHAILCHGYLPWLPWGAQHKHDTNMILSIFGV
jgi:hypothetical protein